jgi:hypothetical protein
MHPVLGTMMPKICEAPHLPASRFQPSCRSELNKWGAFISFSYACVVQVESEAVALGVPQSLTFFLDMAGDL